MSPTTSTPASGNKMGIGKVFRLPKGLKSSTKTKAVPIEGETPAVLLKIQIVGCKDLRAADRNGKSDPFVVISFAGKRQQTPVIKKTLYPEFPPKESTFTFPLYFSSIASFGSLELIAWDKDLVAKNDYLGEISLSIDEWFKWNNGNGAAFDDAQLPFSVPLESTDSKIPASGTMQLKIGFIPPTDTPEPMDYQMVYQELLVHTRLAGLSLDTAPPTRGIGTLGSGDEAGEFEDDGLSSDDEYDYDSPATNTQPLSISPKGPAPQLKPTVSSPRFQLFKRPGASRQESNASVTTTAAADGAATPSSKPTRPEDKRRPTFKSLGSRANTKSDDKEFKFDTGGDIQGIVMIEVASATDLPKLKNMTRTGWDMDPFVVVAFGKKVFRTRVIRHSRTPTWDEKLLFHVRRHETGFRIQFSVLDWDKLSGNDHIADVHLELSELMKDLPARDPQTGLYPYLAEPSDQQVLKEFKLELLPAKDASWEGKHKPVLTIRAKYQPYDALRQRFWHHYLQQYDSDNTGLISHIELTSMLDSLGSTLSQQTLDGFFARFNKNPDTEELTFDEAVRCIEEEIARPREERRKINADDVAGSGPGTGTHTPIVPSPNIAPAALEGLDFTGPSARPNPNEQAPAVDSALNAEPSQVPLSTDPNASTGSSDAEDESSGSGASDVERVINIKTCPLCHRPRLKGKAEADIVTHLAVCASGDWARVDRIVVGNFVTASQAQRKWYTKMLGKVTAGEYQLGANSANIIVQNRITGALEEEKMQGYVRIGIRLLYKGASSRMEGGRARKLLKSMSIKQGQKYDSPESAREIPAFIAFHNLNVDEIKDPLDSFKSFNEFFYRKLKETARPVDQPQNPGRLVSCADCRMMAFETVNEATRLWIKGREFSVKRLLGETYANEWPKYDGGALGIFRLAPQDYHRFHSPVDGVIGPMTYISGEYYTVNPQAIRTQLDVYGDNARKIVPMDSPTFGRVMCVCIGAMMVGSIITTVKEGDQIARGQEFGYFAFGGSTIVILFEKGKLTWDEDILANGKSTLETLVRVGMGVGNANV
ncbi:phosphatidylserine decarboxylase family protein [Ceratobasidium sp. AG-Ba]|nr:phosphatidylserine decarboxylase family protein [Ceratobasidium sp. AG-Ba]